VIDWLVRVVKGVIISLGFILPGVSGGVLAAILGIYEKILRFLAHIRTDFVKNILYFLPVGIGGILGLILLSRPLEFVLEHWQVPVLWGFAGAIVGSIPALVREARAGRARLDQMDYLWLIGTFLLGGGLLYALPALAGTVPPNFAGFVLAGALIALGVLVPGLSPSNLLIILGLFTAMLRGFDNRDLLGTFLPIALGAVVTLLLFAKLMERLLDRYRTRVFSLIIGLVAASTALIVIPTHSAETIDYTGSTFTTWLAAAVLFALGAALGWWMSRLEDKYKAPLGDDDQIAEVDAPLAIETDRQLLDARANGLT